MAHYFHAAYKVAGTKSWRLSSTKLLGYGDNEQNQSDEARRAFVPRPGHRFVQCDLEGAEAVAVALLVREGQFRDLIRLGIKPHNFVCLHLFPDKFAEFIAATDIANLTPRLLAAHVNYKQIIALCKKLKREYDLAKKTVHGSNYSMGWATFRDTVLKGTKGLVVLSAAEAKRMLETYFALFPEVKEYQQRIEQTVKEHGPIYNLFGHRAQFIGRFTGELARTATSWPPQSTVGMCSNIAACRMQERIERNGYKWNVLTIVHDSILLEAPAAEILTAAAALVEDMSFKFTSPIDGWSTGIGVEVQIGDNWGKFDEHENPRGLKVTRL